MREETNSAAARTQKAATDKNKNIQTTNHSFKQSVIKMKKVFLIGLAATALMASCSNEETAETDRQNAISFSNAFVNKSTRSYVNPSLTSSSVANFDVYGFTQNGQIFDGTNVSKDASSNWVYSPLQYWVPGNTYTFAAIAPSGAGTVSGEEVANGKVNMTVNFKNDGQTDLLYAAPDQVAVDASAKNYTNTVELTFNHLLSKVKFSFANGVGDGYFLKVTDIHITDAKELGDFTVSTTGNAWSNQSGALDLDFGNAIDAQATSNEAAAIANAEEAESYNERLLLPTDANASYTVTFTVQLLQGANKVEVGTFNRAVTIKNVPLQMGYSYDFKATLTAENIVEPDNPLHPIQFTVTSVKDWVEESADNTVVTIPTTSQAGN